MAAHLGSERDGTYLRRAGSAPRHARARRRLPASNGVRRRAARSDRLRAYSVTKHAAVAFAEWLSITYAESGIKVSCLCPQGVRTKMLLGEDGTRESFLLESALTTQEVAEAVVEGLTEERFLILPHPEVAEYFRRKAMDYERWLRGMRRLQARAELSL